MKRPPAIVPRPRTRRVRPASLALQLNETAPLARGAIVPDTVSRPVRTRGAAKLRFAERSVGAAGVTDGAGSELGELPPPSLLELEDPPPESPPPPPPLDRTG